MSISPNNIIIKDSIMHLEVLYCDNNYAYCLEVTNGYEYNFNEYYDKDELTKLNDDDKYQIDEFFLYGEDLFLVDAYSYHLGSIHARKVHRAVSVHLLDIEAIELYDFYDYYIKKEDMITNV